METSRAKMFAECMAGIFGGTILGIAAFLTLTNYGGNNGCWAFVDGLTGMVGYESCGAFGAVTGIVVGVVAAMAIFNRLQIVHFAKAGIYLFVASFVVPFVYGVIMFWPPFQDGDLLIVPPLILVFILFSAIPSVLIILSKHWRHISRRT